MYRFFYLKARIKAFREQQRSRLDGRHKYIISLVALRIGLSAAEVEDYLLDGDQVVQEWPFYLVHFSPFLFSWTGLIIFLLLMDCVAFCCITKKQRPQLLVGIEHSCCNCYTTLYSRTATSWACSQPVQDIREESGCNRWHRVPSHWDVHILYETQQR